MRSLLLLFLAALAASLLNLGSLPDRESAGSVPLTQEELAWFNEEFFNGDSFSSFHNQFMTCLYDRPEDIDLFELFYNGVASHDISQEELDLLLGPEGWPDIWPVKTTAQEMNDALLANTGLSSDQTNQVNLDFLDYLPETDSYYHFHSDTNYSADFYFTAGGRDGEWVRLYYNADERFLNGDFVSGWVCLTLQQVGEGYHFVSHQLCETPTALLP